MRTAGIEGKSLVRPGAAEPAVLRLRFKDNDLLTPFMEEAGKGKAGKAAAKYRSRHCLQVERPDLYA